MTATAPTPRTAAATGPGALGRRSLAMQGARDMTPMVLGVVPFGLAIGATIGASGIDTGAGLASAPLILAGAAQMATIQMLDAGVAPAVIVTSALLINARLLLYGASIAPWFADLPPPARMVLAGSVIDQTHFVCVPRFERGDLDQAGRVAYYTGAAGWLIGAWLASQCAAVLLGAQLPEAAHLEMAGPLALVGLLARSVDTRPAGVAAAAATAVAALGAGLPFHTSILAAICLGMFAGVATEAATATPNERSER